MFAGAEAAGKAIRDGFGVGATSADGSPGALTGGQLLIRALAEQGAEYLFNLPGNGVYPMLDPLVDYPHIRYVMGVHEQSLTFTADGYARASGKVPFVNLYMAPGTNNAMNAIYTAYRDRVPMVVTATQQTRSIVGRDAYASAADLPGVARQFAKWAWEVTQPERLPEAIHRAHKIAAEHPQGPVYLTLPVDLFPARPDRPLVEPSRPSAVPRLGPPPSDVVEEVAAELLSAERVLFICGKDSVTCDASDLITALAEEVGAAGVSEPWSGTVAFPRPHPLGLGEYGRDVIERLRPTLVVGFGARMFIEAVANPEPAFPMGTQVAMFGVGAEDLGRQQPADVAAVCDVRLAAQALLDVVRARGGVEGERRSARVAAVEAYQADERQEAQRTLEQRYDARPMSLARLSTELNHAITRDTVLVEHSTTSTGMLMTYLDLPQPRNVFSTGGSVQGWGTPAAIGVQMGRPDQRVLAVVGDGGFTFTCQGLWTAAKYQVPVTILVLNNRGYRSMRGGMERGAPRSTEARLDWGYDFEVGIRDIARGFGVQADRVEDPADLAEAVRTAMDDPRPRVLEVMISPALEFKKSRNQPVAM